LRYDGRVTLLCQLNELLIIPGTLILDLHRHCCGETS
jgi:hypothetical protein